LVSSAIEELRSLVAGGPAVHPFARYVSPLAVSPGGFPVFGDRLVVIIRTGKTVAP
jgi:hypothetical protein